MTANSIILLVLIPFLAGILTTLIRGWVAAQRAVGALSLLATFGLAIGYLVESYPATPLVSQLGGWEAPFGIAIVFDTLSGLMIAAVTLVAFACFLASFSTMRPQVERDWFHPLFHLLLMGLNYAFLTGDLFNLFVAFEIVLLASYALLCLGGSREQLSQAYKYVMLNLIGSTFFVLGAGLVYGMAGTLNFADLAMFAAEAQLPGGEPLPPAFYAVSMLLLFVFALKSAVFPLWFWLPDTYHTCSISIVALFGGVLTKLGIYALIRIYPMVFAAHSLGERSAVVVALSLGAGLTLVLAALGALGMGRLRRVLALVLVSSIGYQIFGVAMMTPDALGAAVFYAVQSMLVIAALFLCCGIIEAHADTDEIAKVSGLLKRAPWLGVLMFLAGLSLVGLPPFSGFFPKLALVLEGFVLEERGFWILSMVALVTGFLTLIVFAKVWGLMFWSPARGWSASEPGEAAGPFPLRSLVPAYAGVTILVVASLAAGFAAEGLNRLALAATEELTAPRTYVAAVLGERWPDEIAERPVDVKAERASVMVTQEEGR